MSLHEYDVFVDETALESSKEYFTIGFCGEAGEVANEVKKEIRNKEDRSEKVLSELGDTLWYLVALAHKYGWHLQDIINFNIEKLTERRKTGTIKGR